MSLKVLLADDSAAIKKVVQLSLQDFGILLKTVGSGKDVLDVARAFQPDIALVDVLLPHKTGYEIATELKSDPQLSKIPIIMLWSSFMAFDEKKFKASGAEDKLEKPFEVAGLRGLINKYVPRTQKSDLAKHLEFPHVEFEGAKNKPNPNLVAPGNPENWSMDSFEDITKFDLPDIDNALGPKPHDTNPHDIKSPFQVPSFLNQIVSPSQEKDPKVGADANSGMWSGDSEWVRKDLSKFKVSVPDESNGEENQAFEYPTEQITNTDFLLKPKSSGFTIPPLPGPQVTQLTEMARGIQGIQEHQGIQEIPPIPDLFSEPSTSPTKMPTSDSDLFMTPIPNKPPIGAASSNSDPITEAMTREIRSQAREIIEKVVWKVVPEIASNVIKEELQRLLGEEK